MITKLFLRLYGFPSWLKSMKRKNPYLYYSVWGILSLAAITTVNFLTFRNAAVYFIVMALIPALWTVAHIICLAVLNRRQGLEGLPELNKMIAVPHTSSFLTDNLPSLMIIFVAGGFDGSENDYLYVLFIVFVIKIGISLFIRKTPFKGSLSGFMAVLVLSNLLSLVIYALAATV
jgi:hypothetical protein